MERDLIIDIDEAIDKLVQDEPAPVAKPEPKAKPEPRTEAAPQKDDRLDTLTKELTAKTAEVNAEREKREKAERLAAENAQEAARNAAYATNADYVTITTAINAHNEQIAGATKAIKAALEANDGEALANAQRLLARAEANLTRLEDGKADLESRLQAQRQAAAEPPKPEPQREDPFEKFVKQFPKTSQDWLREHPDYVTDPKLHKKLMGYVHLAESEGHTAHSPEFIGYLEDKLGLAEKHEEEPEEEEEVEVEERPQPKPAAKAQRAMPAAPVSRGTKTFSSSNLNGSRVKLSARLAAEAKAMGFDPVEYAKHAARAVKEGKVSKNLLDADYQFDPGI